MKTMKTNGSKFSASANGHRLATPGETTNRSADAPQVTIGGDGLTAGMTISTATTTTGGIATTTVVITANLRTGRTKTTVTIRTEVATGATTTTTTTEMEETDDPATTT